MEYPQSKESEPEKEGIRQLPWQPSMVGERVAVEEHLGGGTSPCNKCLHLEPKVMRGSRTPELPHKCLQAHTAISLCFQK